MTVISPDLAATRKKTISRLNRIEGQVRGVTRMLEEDRYCIDVLTQLSAVKSALASVEREVLKDHSRHCLETAIEQGNPAEQRAKIGELIELLSRHYKLDS